MAVKIKFLNLIKIKLNCGFIKTNESVEVLEKSLRSSLRIQCHRSWRWHLRSIHASPWTWSSILKLVLVNVHREGCILCECVRCFDQ